MVQKSDLKKIDEFVWEISKDYRSDMLVPARIYTSEKMLADILKDRSVEQLVNVATLGGIVGCALVMPDVHEGYGFPIGGVAATLYPDGIITPGGIGYDINCGVRLLLSDLRAADLQPYIQKLVDKLFKNIPSGVGRGGSFRIGKKDFDRVLEKGASWVVEYGLGKPEDLLHIESSGSLKTADSKNVSNRAKERGIDQLGTLGAGNHFVEVDTVSDIYDPKIAGVFGIFEGQVAVLIHTGSRGLGHQIATDYIQTMLYYIHKRGLKTADRELAGAPLSSPEGRNYFSAMCAGANFAWANRQIITEYVRNVWKDLFGKDKNLSLLYDVAHNIAKIEEHEIEGESQKLIVHRKGATRSFGPESSEIPQIYRKVGQPVIIPGSMGSCSYVLAGSKVAMRSSFGSTCHGAGRQMSRHEAKRKFNPSLLKKELLSQNIHFAAGSLEGLVEEAPLAYKDVNEVVEVVSKVGLAKKVARLKPLGVIKG